MAQKDLMDNLNPATLGRPEKTSSGGASKPATTTTAAKTNNTTADASGYNPYNRTETPSKIPGQYAGGLMGYGALGADPALAPDRNDTGVKSTTAAATTPKTTEDTFDYAAADRALRSAVDAERAKNVNTPVVPANTGGGDGRVNTTYTDANGNKVSGYIVNGTTYDSATGQPIGAGSRVTTADGKEYIKTNNGSMLYSDYLALLNHNNTGGGANGAATGAADTAANRIAAEAATSAAQQQAATRNADFGGSTPYKTVYKDANGNNQTGYIINGTTYADPEGKTPVPVGSIVRDEMGRAWQKTENGSKMIYSPDLNDYWFYDDIPGTGKGSDIPWQEIKTIPLYNDEYNSRWSPDAVNGYTGNIGMRAEGGYNVYDRNGNTVLYIDSAGNMHGLEGHDPEYAKAWEEMTWNALGEKGITKASFTGNGLDYEGKMLGGWRDDIGSLNQVKGWHYNDAVGQKTPYVYDPFGNTDLSLYLGDYDGKNSTPEFTYDGRTAYQGPSGNGASGAPVNGTGYSASQSFPGTPSPNQTSGLSPEVAQLLSGLNNAPAAASSSGIDIQPYLDAMMNGQNTSSAPTPSGIDVKPYLDALMSGQGDQRDIQYYLDQIKAQNPQDAAAIDAYVAAALDSKRPDIPQAPDLKPMLDEWRTNEELRQQRSIDYATDQGVTNLQRAEEDAQQGFRTAQEQITADEMRSRDNQALYAEARGDKGGIGAAQYDSIANAAAINRQNVRDSQIKLSTDTARQIEDLRNQGEFKKADAVLQISQEYLSNLMSLEQWAANYGLNAAQFEEAIREWEQNFKLNVANITGELNGVQTLAARNADRDFAMNLMNYDLNRQNADRDYAMNLMNYDLNRTNADRNYELNKQNSDRDYMMNLVNYDLNRTNADRNYDLNRTNSDRDWAMNLMNYDLNKTNADRNFGLNEAGVTGYYGGRATLEKTNADRNFGLNEANVTGYYNGSPTMAKTNADRNFELEKTNADRNFRLNEANVTGTYNGAPTYAATKQNTSNLSSIGMSMLQAGIMPSTDMLRAMGIGEADAQAYLMGLQTAAAAKKGSGGGGGGGVVTGNTAAYTALFEAARNSDNPYEYLAKNAKTFGLSVNDNLWNNYTQWENSPTGGQYINPANIGDTASAWLGRFKNGTGSWNDAQKVGNKIQELADQGKITAEEGVWIGRELGLW